ncbi:hypothetical protein SBA4_930020 [Candidatus Sulfopaludibacter sp. SbA4]|nr:hypothetical protein SBA4_930020 [Candidatus Sulfopaludibacter sp. SbA4]
MTAVHGGTALLSSGGPGTLSVDPAYHFAVEFPRHAQACATCLGLAILCHFAGRYLAAVLSAA